MGSFLRCDMLVSLGVSMFGELEAVCTVLYVGLFFLCFGLSTSLFCVLFFFLCFLSPT